MTILEFVNKYNEQDSFVAKDELIQSVIKRKYVPVLEKQVVLQQFLDKSITTGAYGVKYINSFLSKINIVVAILLLYTNLDLSKTANSETNSFDDYDTLMEYGLIDKIYEKISNEELKELKSIYDGIIKDFEKEFKTVESYMSKQVEKFATIFGSAIAPGLEHLASAIGDENKMSKYLNQIKSFIKS